MKNQSNQVPKVVQIVQTIENNPHFKKQDCEFPVCVGTVHMIQLVHPSYLYIIDRSGNIKDPVDGIWQSCKECGKAMFFCGSYCQEKMDKQCYTCQKCQANRCPNKYYEKCTICGWKKCKDHLEPCIYCSEPICNNKIKGKNQRQVKDTCGIADTGICKNCWCAKCQNPAKDYCFCEQCSNYHDSCTC